MASTYLLYVAVFGALVIACLWLRDARIFYRTGLPGYRKAAYMGVLYTALGLLGIYFALAQAEFIGLGIILAALYIQGRERREKVFGNDTTAAERLLGRAAARQKKDERGYSR
ncbi:MAG TPA: ABC transporter permease [Methanoculleus sp.]|nr:ABC transporter permease [Methanoculleus sp.]